MRPRSNFSAAARATARWPRCTGSNVPPNRAIFIFVAALQTAGAPLLTSFEHAPETGRSARKPASHPITRKARVLGARPRRPSSCAYLLCLFLKAERLGTRFTPIAFFFALRAEAAFLG